MLIFLKTLVITVLSLLGIFATDGASNTPIDMHNGGDPMIAEEDGRFYYTFTTGGGIDIREIADFDDTTVLSAQTVYWSGNDGIAGDIWAPELHKIDGKWYILASARFAEDAVARGVMPEGSTDEEHGDYYRYGFVLESDSILGPYTFKGILAPDGLNNIDGTYLQKDGKLYFVCSAYLSVANQHLYICEMENPYTLKTDADGKNNAVCLSSPVLKWEKQGWHVNEGPAVLYHEDDIFIVFSASGFSSGGYCMGMLTLTGDDVLNACHWQKTPVPVHQNQPKNSIYNAGHCSFLYRADGSVQMVYHATPTEKFEDSPRLTYIKEVQFKCGVPLF